MIEPLPLFVFGTLRQGHSNHHLLADALLHCVPATLPGFRRGVTEHGFPSAELDLDARLEGELIHLRPETYLATLARLDELEDLPPGQLRGRFYQRAIVAVQTAEGPVLAWAYIDPLCPVNPAGQALLA